MKASPTICMPTGDPFPGAFDARHYGGKTSGAARLERGQLVGGRHVASVDVDRPGVDVTVDLQDTALVVPDKRTTSWS